MAAKNVRQGRNNTLAVEHDVDTGSNGARRPKVRKTGFALAQDMSNRLMRLAAACSRLDGSQVVRGHIMRAVIACDDLAVDLAAEGVDDAITKAQEDAE